MFHMGWFLPYGFGVYGWNELWSGNVRHDVAKPGLYVDMATSLERAGFDYFMVEDSLMVPDAYAGNSQLELKHARYAPKLDPMCLVPLLTRFTKHLGVIATGFAVAFS